jgi:hypothetical protein
MPSTKRASIKNNSPLDNLFGSPTSTGAPTATAETNGKGDKQAPVAEAPELRQTTIMVYDEQLDWLEQKCTEARSNKGKSIRKAVVIRALIDLARSSAVDLSGLKTDEELLVRIERAIKARK